MTKNASYSCGAFALLCALQGGEVAAQTALVTPLGLESAEGNSGGTMPGFSARYRQQILVSGTRLAAARGRSLTAVSFRRDDLFGKPYSGSTCRLHVEVSHAARPPLAPARSFAENRGPAPITVLDGLVSLPATPAPPNPIPWTAPFIVRLPFSPAFAYQGGDLCIEIEGTPESVPPRFSWWVDYEHEADVGTVEVVGTPCGNPAAENELTARAWGRNMVPGSTFSIMSFGYPGTVAVVMLGTPLAVPAPLDLLGATGCSLYLQPAVQLGVPYPPASPNTAFGALYTDIHLPGTPLLLGARFRTQSANFEPAPLSNRARLTTTNALDVTLGASMPAGHLSIVRSAVVELGEPFPATGRVSVSRGPVMRFELQ